MNRDIEQLLRRAQEQGFELRHRKREKHYKIMAPDGLHMIVVPRTPSDHRSYRNTVQYLKRHGYQP